MRCRGHENISATHENTVEFSLDSEITGRATCVVGVDARFVTSAAPVAGPIRVTIEADGRSAQVRAGANSRWRPGRNMVLRRGPDRLPNTLGTEADLGSARLPRDLITALSRPETSIEVTVQRDRPEAATLVLYRATGPEDRLAAEVAAAGTVFTRDAPASELVAGTDRIRSAAARPIDHDHLRAALAANGRALVVATSGGFTEEIGAVADQRDVRVEVLGLPAEQTVSAVSPRRVPVLSVDAGRTRGLVRVLRTATRHALVLRCSHRDFPRVRELLLRERETGIASFAMDVPWQAERPWRGPVPALPERPPGGTADVLLRVEPAEETSEVPEIPAVAFVRALLDDGVSPKTLSRALADTTDYSRREAYEFVHELVDRSPER
ncbi:hypothetical protein FB471_5587 [Amycolatopsis cihanbeyliensis]|uniref:DUF371 domain-containing protein n=1 Tax=Amycolatopsis cihanbeyliensis TaxID=1128664 RepID=A0A542DRP3_AMYCI|nr:hypothetical protein FB471_5587 [Amycolatopsis cihanbeyliensis]